MKGISHYCSRNSDTGRLRAALKTTINNLSKYDFGKNIVDGLGAKRVSHAIKRELEGENQIWEEEEGSKKLNEE